MDVKKILVENLILLFITLWVLNSFLASIVGGWSRLSEEFECDDRFDGQWKSFQSGSIGIVGYGHCLWIASSEKGVYLKTGPLFFFRLFHPPLLIPWKAVRKVTNKKFLWHETLVLEFEQPRVKVGLPLSSLVEQRRFWSHLSS